MPPIGQDALVTHLIDEVRGWRAETKSQQEDIGENVKALRDAFDADKDKRYGENLLFQRELEIHSSAIKLLGISVSALEQESKEKKTLRVGRVTGILVVLAGSVGAFVEHMAEHQWLRH